MAAPLQADGAVYGWIAPEVERGLGEAIAGLGRVDAEIAPGVSSTPAASAFAAVRAALAQVRGALELVGLDGAVPVLREVDALLARPSRDADAARRTIAACQHACGRLSVHLSAVLRGQSPAPALLHALLRDLQSAHGHVDATSAGAQCTADDAVVEQVRRLRERLALLQSSWEQYAGLDPGPLPAVCAQLEELRLAGLPHPALSSLARELEHVVAALPAPLAASAAREVAVALLFMDDVLVAWPQTSSLLDAQAAAVVRRLRAALSGQPDVQARQVDLRTEPARRSHERAIASALSAELLTLVRAVEQRLVACLEEGAQRDSLDLAGKWLRQMHSVLSLAVDDPRAAAAAAFCAEHIGRWAAGHATPRPEESQRVAAVLSGLSHYLESLPFAAADLATIMRRAGAPEALYAVPAPPAEPDLRASSAPVAGPPSSAPERVAETQSGSPTDAASDPEMLQVFLEEAREVLRAVTAELDILAQKPSDGERLGAVRRGFHTLKGSGRMVELDHLGEAAWAVEQVLNGVLQRGQPASADLLRLLRLAVARVGDWIGQLEHTGEARIDSVTVLEWAERVKRSEPLPVEDGAGHSAARRGGQPPADAAPPAVSEQTVEIGRARVSSALFATFLAEAAQHVSTLRSETAGLRDGAGGAASYESFRAAHTLGGIAGTIGVEPMSELAGGLERVLQLLHHRPRRLAGDELGLLAQAIQTLETMLDAVRRLRAPAPAAELNPHIGRLADRLLADSGGLDRLPPLLTAEVPSVAADSARTDAAVLPDPAAMPDAQGGTTAPAGAMPWAQLQVEPTERRRNRIADDIDRDLLPLFLEEASDLVPQIGQDLRDWRAAPGARSFAESLKRLLHTLKGSARMAGAMGLGELTHGIETRIAGAAELPVVPDTLFDDLEASFDRIGAILEQLERGEAEGTQIQAPPPGAGAQPTPIAAPRSLLRMRADVLDRLVDEAGEVSIARSRMEGELRTMRSALRDLTETVIRMRSQVREIELQAESQLQSRMAQAEQTEEPFDPLEFDRFTRLQELTRFLAETGSDVSVLQQGILSSVDGLEGALTAQRRMTRVLQDGLMRVRLIPFSRMADRLQRVARLTAREAGKRASLDIRGGRVELERAVMERIAAPLEHILRNAIVHGLETPGQRRQAGKRETGAVALEARQEGNEVVLVLSDDGRGLDLPRIRERALAAGIVRAEDVLSDDDVAQLIFTAGVSTAEQVTEAAGRGVGLDVVRTEIGALGGRLQLAFQPGQGTTFTIYLPIMLSVMQAVLVRSGDQVFALPTLMVEQVQKVKPDALERLFAAGQVVWRDRVYPIHELQHLLGNAGHAPVLDSYNALLLLRSGARRAAIRVDELVGNQEIVVKSIGAQLARVTGIAGAAVLGSGQSVLILNPVLLTQSASGAAAPVSSAPAPRRAAELEPEALAPTVMVVDDSLTIRRITGRLLARAGYEVVEARDGADAVEKLRTVLPHVLLLDIEMPRMDGFELTRHVRDDPRLRHIPIIVISSRTADKHRRHAAELGVNLFLGKPYQEDELLARIAGFVAGLKPTTA
jgi:chemosensory pili system protein ChpA (sensor histidine kinase/response regulator)